jgi:branched-chain amino acid transport system substrate-binding protein
LRWPVNNLVKEKNSIMINTGAASSDLTNAQCSPNTIHWVYDTYMLANSTGQALVKAGGDTWYFSPRTTPSAMRWSATPPQWW